MNKCPVCGYDELRKPAYDCFEDPPFGIEFGYEDAMSPRQPLLNVADRNLPQIGIQ